MEKFECRVYNIFDDDMVGMFLSNPNSLFAIGLNGVGRNLFTLMEIIHQATEKTINLVVWLAADDIELASLLNSLGVNSLICESCLSEELPKRLVNMLFSSSQFQIMHKYPLKGAGIKKLTKSELGVLIDYSRGLDIHEISRLRNISDKTVYAHIHNARLRLNLDDRTRWFSLLTRLRQISSLE